MTVLADSTAVTAVVLALAGLVMVLAVSAIFYVIGRGEDRDREREAARGANGRVSAASPAGPPPRRFRRRP